MTYISATDATQLRVRQARCWLKIDGVRLPCITATVTRKSERKADAFSAELSVDETATAGFGYAEWADYQPTDVEILMSLDGGDPVSMITGQIDEPHIHWGECTVSVSGRDKSASLTEKRTSTAYKNQKTSDIVPTIAQAHGLDASVADTGDFAGKVYDTDFVHLLANLSDHEALSRLAEREGYRWYVDGTTLYFEPKGTDTDTYDVQWVPPDGKGQVGRATVLDLDTHRNMTAARPHNVTTKSWHHKDAKKYEGKASATGVGDTVEIEHHHNGRNQPQVDKLSKSRLKEAIRHDCSVTVKAPADLSVTPRQKLSLTGTGTIFDQLYDIDSVEITVAWEAGSDMTVMGKIAKSGRTGTDDSGSTSYTATNPSQDAPLPPERPAGVGAQTVTPSTSGGIGRA